MICCEILYLVDEKVRENVKSDFFSENFLLVCFVGLFYLVLASIDLLGKPRKEEDKKNRKYFDSFFRTVVLLFCLVSFLAMVIVSYSCLA